MIFRIFYFLIFSFSAYASELNKSYCIGYFEELYWSLDTIEEEDIRLDITKYFSNNFKNANLLDFDLFYDPNLKQFINSKNDSLIKVNYPNFEIIILDTYINLFTNNGNNYCPAFWYDCNSESLDFFFQGAEDFNKAWKGENNVLSFLNKEFVENECYKLLNTDIQLDKFILKLNVLIKELTK